MRIRDLLQSVSIDRSDAEVLLGHLLGRDRMWLLAHDEETVEPETTKHFTRLANRRLADEPTAYIVGEKEWYGRTMCVGPGVLVPRACTEELVTTALALLDSACIEPVREIDEGVVVVARRWRDCSNVRTVVDVGTGSGCIAITLACERTALRCIAIDISERAVEIARENVERWNVADRVTVQRGDLLEPVLHRTEPFLVVSNPPYVADPSLLAPDVRMHEPREALIGSGKDGATTLRKLVQQAQSHPLCHGIIVECLSSQAAIVPALPPT